MALTHPSLTTTGRKPGRQKFKSAAEAQRARELQRDWDALQAKWGVKTEPKRQRRVMAAPLLKYDLDIPAGRSTHHLPSLDTGHSGPVSSKPAQHYTGTKMIGVGQLHKSNAVPVFCDQDAIDIARMRR